MPDWWDEKRKPTAPRMTTEEFKAVVEPLYEKILAEAEARRWCEAPWWQRAWWAFVRWAAGRAR